MSLNSDTVQFIQKSPSIRLKINRQMQNLQLIKDKQKEEQIKPYFEKVSDNTYLIKFNKHTISQQPTVINHPGVIFRGPTSRVVRATFLEAGFHVLDKTSKRFNIVWACPKNSEFIHNVQPFQIINQLAGQQFLTRKDNLGTTIYEQQKLFPHDYNFIPQTFVLPECINSLRLDMKNNPKKIYIQKTAGGARGEGIRLIQSASQYKNKHTTVVQEYLQNVCLINGKKFDMRVYCVVTSADPLLVYYYKDGIGRIASKDYKKATQKNMHDKTIHLTNYSVNRKMVCKNQFLEESSNQDDQMQVSDIKLTLSKLIEMLSDQKDSIFEKQFIQYLENNNIQLDKYIWHEIEKIVQKTMIAGYQKLSQYALAADAHCFPRKQFGFYGFDIIILKTGELKLLEVNVSPSTGTGNQEDYDLKNQLLRDMFDLVGVPVKISGQKVIKPTYGDSTNDKTPKQAKVSENELSKQRFSRTGEQLTSYEHLCIKQFREEQQRLGNFAVAVPNIDPHYLKLINTHKNVNVQLQKELAGMNQTFSVQKPDKLYVEQLPTLRDELSSASSLQRVAIQMVDY